MTVGRKCRSVEAFSTADWEEDSDLPPNLRFGFNSFASIRGLIGFNLWLVSKL